jgi:hypothetical protein
MWFKKSINFLHKKAGQYYKTISAQIKSTDMIFRTLEAKGND